MFELNFLTAIILGLVEGITEFLPISSTGHLIITSQLLNLNNSEFLKSFEVIIQLGAILAVIAKEYKYLFFWQFWDLWKNVIITFIPTAVIGLIFYSFIKKYLLGNLLVVAIALVLGGILILLFENWYSRKTFSSEKKIHFKYALLLGLGQSLALIPGISRSGATILSGLALGLNRVKIIEFSFLLALPTMGAATSLDLIKSGWSFTPNQWSLLALGLITAFISAYFVLEWLIKYISAHDFKAFAWYRIIVGITILFWVGLK